MPPSDRFVNLALDVSLSGGADDLSRRVLAALRMAPSSGPLTLYLPVSMTLQQNLTIPSRCEVMMGPGVVITLAPSVLMRIEGAVDLGLEPRFAVGDGAAVRLLGALECIRPEWWMTGGADAALDEAAHTAVARADAGRPLVAIRLVGPYLLRRTWDLGALAQGRAMRFELEGRHPRGDAALRPTFLHHPASEGGFPLLRTRVGVSVRAVHVAFDTTVERSGVDEVDVAVEHNGEVDGVTYLRCSFFGTAARIARSAPDGERTTELPTVLFDGCWFQAGTRDRSADAMLRVDPTWPVRLHVNVCSFAGSARAMVEMSVGVLDLSGAVFDNVGPDPRQLVDLDLSSGSSVPVDHAGRFLTVNEVHVRTRGQRHLHAERDLSDAAAVVSMTGVVHDPIPADTPGVRLPVIRWRGPLGAPLLLQGCHFASPLDLPGPGTDRIIAASVVDGQWFEVAPAGR